MRVPCEHDFACGRISFLSFTRAPAHPPHNPYYSFLMHVTSASEEEIMHAVRAIPVPCVNLTALMCEAGWEAGSVDLLHIDAEGFDDAVLRASDISATRPKLIRLEAQHIDADTTEKVLQQYGYKTIRFNSGVSEILAVRMVHSNVPPKRMQCGGYSRRYDFSGKGEVALRSSGGAAGGHDAARE